MTAKAQALEMAIRPPMIQARMPVRRSPPVALRIFSALKKMPLPMTMPTTMQMAVGRPYFFVSCCSKAGRLLSEKGRGLENTMCQRPGCSTDTVPNSIVYFPLKEKQKRDFFRLFAHGDLFGPA